MRKSTRKGWKKFTPLPIETDAPLRVSVWVRNGRQKAHKIDVDCNNFKDVRPGAVVHYNQRPEGTCAASRKNTLVGLEVVNPDFVDRCAHCTKLPKVPA